MMAKKKETAEQKLLKMIEDSGAGESSASKAEKKAFKKQSTVSLLKTFNNLLIAVGVLVFIFMVSEIKAGAELLNKKIEFEVAQGPVSNVVNPEDVIPEVGRLSSYLANVKRRNLFQPFTEGRNMASVSNQNSRIANKTAAYRLVGISWLDKIETAAVLIEDTNKDETYFLNAGEKLGDIVVKTIYAESAVLGYENEEIEIQYDKSQM